MLNIWNLEKNWDCNIDSVGLSADTIYLSNKPHTYNKITFDIEEWLNAEAVLLIIY